MLELVDQLADTLGVDPRLVVMSGLLLGAFLVILSIIVTLREGASVRSSRRLAAADSAPTAHEGLFHGPVHAPTGLAKAFLPSEEKQRSQVRRNLTNAGIDSPNAVIIYFALRIVVGLFLPAVLAVLVLFRDSLPLPPEVKFYLSRIGSSHLLLLLGLIMAIGFYGPAYWLSSRAKRRREQIEMGFPNTLDLLQVSIEAGLGFDAALARVGEEMAFSSPEISAEFRLAQQEILAGRDREQAYRAMAERLAIDEALAFVNVVLQSLRFGTSMSQALLAYSGDMRQRREIRAQEKANKLPVYMSAVMAGLMMPALLIVTIGPVAIRYMRGF